MRLRSWSELGVLLLVVACSSSKGSSQDVAPEAGLPKCPDEAELTELPCDCYGNVVYDPSAQVPGCKTRVVCCPTVKNLRCEDHELLDVLELSIDTTWSEEVPEVSTPEDTTQGEQTALTDEAAPEATPEVSEVSQEGTQAPEVTYPKCPYEVDLSKANLPCNCKGTIVHDPKEALPDCTKKVVCCPVKGLVCE